MSYDFLGGGLAKTPSTRALILLLRSSSLDSSPLGHDVLNVDRLNGLLDRRLLDPDLLDELLADDLFQELLEEPLADDLLVEPLGEDLAETWRRLGGDLPGNDLLNEPLGTAFPATTFLASSPALTFSTSSRPGASSTRSWAPTPLTT